MFYKNVSLSVKTFHGVTFRPGQVKEVDKCINNLFMIEVDEKEIKKTEEKPQPQQKQQKPSSEKLKKVEEEKTKAEVVTEFSDSANQTA